MKRPFIQIVTLIVTALLLASPVYDYYGDVADAYVKQWDTV